MQKVINLRLYTWIHNTEGIFNYKYIQNGETRDESIKLVQGDINTSLYLARKSNNGNIRFIRQNCELDEENEEIMFRIRKSFKNDIFEIISPISLSLKKTQKNIENLNNNLWYVIKSNGDFFDNDNEDYSLNLYDIIKLGRRKFEVIKYNVNSNAQVKNINISLNYNISEMNKKKGPIFDINIKKTQYILNNRGIKKGNRENYTIKETKEEEENEIKEDLNIKKNETNQIKENEIIINMDKEKESEKEKETIDKQNNIKENNSNNLSINNKKEENSNEYNNYNSSTFEEEENIIRCRICFDFNSSEANPLVCLCSCKDFTHYECLKYYIKTKLDVHDNEKNTVKTYNCHKFNCEVCLMPYPLRFRIPELDKIYELVDLNMPSELDYIVLESLDYIKEKANIKTIHIVQLVDEEYHIGRYESNDIIDNDISVSRNHAILKFDKEKGKLYLKNLSEKFGTLVLIKGNIKMTKNKQINFQVGRSYVSARPDEKTKGAFEENKLIENVNYNSDKISYKN